MPMRRSARWSPNEVAFWSRYATSSVSMRGLSARSSVQRRVAFRTTGSATAEDSIPVQPVIVGSHLGGPSELLGCRSIGGRRIGGRLRVNHFDVADAGRVGEIGRA